MNNLKLVTFLSLLLFLGYSVKAQDNTEEKLNLPGDNLNLYAVMDLFRESKTLEEFEKNLNAEDSKINNLDLNNDDKIDYIKVFDNVDGNVHTIIMQVAVNEKENQDVAVFTVQKDDKNQVQVQLIGDEELYGKDYIIEPNYADESTKETPNPGYAGNNNPYQKDKVVVTKTTYVEVASWPVVTYIYVPTYTVWRSPWYWGFYPPYWNPWRPFYWDYYYGYHSHYYSHYYGYYRQSHYNRYPRYNDNYYHGHRSYSNTVNQHRQSGMYKSTYSRPDTRNQGSADFNKKYPNGYRPDSRPVINSNENRPATRPGTNINGSRPTSNPGNINNGNRPATRPGVNQPSTRPGTDRPTSKPDMDRPSTRPANKTPATRPNVNKPSTRPTTPAQNSKPNINRSSSRPAKQSPSSKPANTRNSKPTSTKSGSDNGNERRR